MTDPKVPEALPAEYGGKWVAWKKEAIERSGVKEAVYEWVPPADERLIGSVA